MKVGRPGGDCRQPPGFPFESQLSNLVEPRQSKERDASQALTSPPGRGTNAFHVIVRKYHHPGGTWRRLLLTVVRLHQDAEGFFANLPSVEPLAISQGDVGTEDVRRLRLFSRLFAHRHSLLGGACLLRFDDRSSNRSPGVVTTDTLLGKLSDPLAAATVYWAGVVLRRLGFLVNPNQFSLGSPIA